jgi:hypothetical protein
MTDTEPTQQEGPPPHPAWEANGGSESPDPTRQLPCPECEAAGTPRFFALPQGLGTHRQKAHGVEGTSKDVVRRRQAKKAKAPAAAKRACPICDKKVVNLPKHIRDVHEKDKVDNGLTADDIFDSVVGMLYPGGQVPTKALTPLLTWRLQTQEMLDTLVSS